MTRTVEQMWILYTNSSAEEKRHILQMILQQPGEMERVRDVIDAMIETGVAGEWVIRKKSRLWDRGKNK